MTKQEQNVRLWQNYIYIYIYGACQNSEIIKETINVDTLVRIASNCLWQSQQSRNVVDFSVSKFVVILIFLLLTLNLIRKTKTVNLSTNTSFAAGIPFKSHTSTCIDVFQRRENKTIC